MTSRQRNLASSTSLSPMQISQFTTECAHLFLQPTEHVIGVRGAERVFLQTYAFRDPPAIA